jgi:hypothetical protein
MKLPYKFLLVFSMLMLTACTEEQRDTISGLSGQLDSIYELKTVIDGKLEEGESGLNINNGIALTITLINTEFNGKSAEEREAKANQLLTVVTEFIAQDKNLSTVKLVTIAYVKHEMKYLIVNFNETIDYYQFDLEQSNQSPSE